MNESKNTILIVGSGLSGATIARELAENGFHVVVIDRKDHIAGHCYDYNLENGIRVHKYGPHIFHTSNETVISWLSRFTTWIDYEHKVVARLDDGKLVPFPPNKATLESVEYTNLVDTFYRPYTEKMWGKTLEELNPKILRRVPIRNDHEDRYFPNDKFQKLPEHGYTQLIDNILDHSSIEVRLNTPFNKDEHSHYFHIFNSMPIDEYFEFRFGELPYRSIKFHHTVFDQRSKSSHAVINFTDTDKFTRETEWKNFPGHGENIHETIVTKEEPCDYRDNNYERYYPVNDAAGENRATYQKYKELTPEKMTFIGRCGQYVYIDMDQAVSSSLGLSRKFLEALE